LGYDKKKFLTFRRHTVHESSARIGSEIEIEIGLDFDQSKQSLLIL